MQGTPIPYTQADVKFNQPTSAVFPIIAINGRVGKVYTKPTLFMRQLPFKDVKTGQGVIQLPNAKQIL